MNPDGAAASSDAPHSQLSDPTSQEGRESTITKKAGRIKVGHVPVTGNKTVGSEGLHLLWKRSLF